MVIILTIVNIMTILYIVNIGSLAQNKNPIGITNRLATLFSAAIQAVARVKI